MKVLYHRYDLQIDPNWILIATVVDKTNFIEWAYVQCKLCGASNVGQRPLLSDVDITIACCRPLKLDSALLFGLTL